MKLDEIEIGTKMNIGTKVLVSNDNIYWESRYFVEFNFSNEYPFGVTRCRADGFSKTSWWDFIEFYKYCKLYKTDL